MQLGFLGRWVRDRMDDHAEVSLLADARPQRTARSARLLGDGPAQPLRTLSAVVGGSYESHEAAASPALCR